MAAADLAPPPRFPRIDLIVSVPDHDADAAGDGK